MYRGRTHPQAVGSFVYDAIAASVFVEPDAPGLTLEEFIEVGGVFDLRRGELQDHLNRQVENRSGARWIPGDMAHELISFPGGFRPDPRNFAAFHFVYERFVEAAREHGADGCWLLPDVVVAEGVSATVTEHDVRVALAAFRWARQLEVGSRGIRPRNGRWSWASPEVQRKQSGGNGPPDADWAKLVTVVRDLVSRRTDGRPRSPNARVAFTDALSSIGHAHLQLWWRQLTSELSTLQPSTHPTSIIVIAAALAEGALAALVTHAKASGLTMTEVKDDPLQWKLAELVRQAKRGTVPLLDDDLGRRCLELSEIRQRVHAGRLITKDPTRIAPDLRPEESQRATETLDRLLRRILDWLALHPA